MRWRMSYGTLKFIFWGLLCLPIFVAGFSIFESLLSETLQVEKNFKRKKTRAQIRKEAEEKAARQAAIEAERQRRKQFDEEYKRTHGI